MIFFHLSSNLKLCYTYAAQLTQLKQIESRFSRNIITIWNWPPLLK